MVSVKPRKKATIQGIKIILEDMGKVQDGPGWVSPTFSGPKHSTGHKCDDFIAYSRC